MPGTYVLKPLEANLTHNTELLGKMNPYCMFSVGNNKIKGQNCEKGGTHPIWNDVITLPATNDSTVSIELKDKDKFTKDDIIGNSVLDLKEVEAKGRISKWYPLSYKNKPAGEILIESVFKPDKSSLVQNQNFQGEKLVQEKQTGAVYDWQVGKREEQRFSSAHEESHQFIEQSQVVEPHSFQKLVDVVEIRTVEKQIEVLEPRKVLKEVQYTELVPVKRQFEINQPQVVMKEVEVIEPTLVTKTIQVVENVRVKKMVEVIENRTVFKDVESFEPQTFTKQVEVTEQVPTRKQVTVSESFSVTKDVEFTEPVITTTTITKELLEPVVIDEKITKTVGPATLIENETLRRERGFVGRYGEVKISEQERRLEQGRLLEQERLEQERFRQKNTDKQTIGYSTSQSKGLVEKQEYSNRVNKESKKYETTY